MTEEILRLIEQEKKLADCAEYRRSRAVPENCYFIDGGVLCYPRTTGDSRYPYSCDGFTLWAHSSGNLSLNESTFYYILPSDEGKQPYCAFFGGIKTKDGYAPVSVTGAARQPLENVKRFTVFTPTAVYYIAVAGTTAYFLRAYVSEQKQAVFTLGAVNTGAEVAETYLSAYFNCLLMHQAGESPETKWFKLCRTTDCGFLFESIEDLDRTVHLSNYGVINRSVKADVIYAEHTCSRADYAGGKTNGLGYATPLFTGRFEKRAQVCKFGDSAVAGDIYAIRLGAGECARIDYVAEAFFDRESAESAVRAVPDGFTDKVLRAAVLKDEQKQNSADMLKMTFRGMKDLNADAFTGFTNNVIRQVEFGALAKNSGVSLLGVRDMVQQAEAALMWTPAACRAKLCEMFNYIDPCGRPPRQYSIPAKGALPQMDTRAFIDQGVWIISAVYSYLAFTGDGSILGEECGYYKIVGKNRVEAVDERNSVAEHLVRVADYLVRNIDGQTGCLKALYGDWNDALDGLGVSRNPDEEFGNGVSVMTSLQLYRNLTEMTEILTAYGGALEASRISEAVKSYERAKKQLEAGLSRYAVEQKDGKRRILHGWGDGRSYKVGSFCDVDGKSRDGLTANAFWVISGAYLWDKTIKRDILESYDRLDGKYGLKTFEPYFAPEVKGVGRIVNLPKGTAENAATYVHATMFGVWSLFKMGEGERAWEQIKKVIPLTHKLITTTPFIMSNSYCYNEELGLDGESMSDWFTGSANVFIKTLVWYVFGIKPDLDGVAVSPAEYCPFEAASIRVCVRGKHIALDYENTHSGKRTFTLNGVRRTTEEDPSSDAPLLYIPFSELSDETVIKVCD